MATDLESSKTCVVLLSDELAIIAPEDSSDWLPGYRACGDPVVGKRAGFPMCLVHCILFTPTKEREEDGPE